MKVFGGLVVVLLLILGAYYLGKNSNSTNQLVVEEKVSPTPRSGSGQKLISPEITVTKLKALCAGKNYEAVALTSLRPEGKGYAVITGEEIVREKNNPIKDYVSKAETLCKVMANSKRTDKSQPSSDTWDYRFVLSLDNLTSSGYEVRYFQGEWRFVLPDMAYL